MITFDKFDKEFAAIIAIGKKVHDLLRKYPDISMDDWRKEGVNPYYDRTSCGLRLEFYYGLPNKLHTPWGYYNIGGGGFGNFTKYTRELFKLIQVTMHQPGKQATIGYIGPIYIVNSVDGIDLPKPSRLNGFEEGFYEASKNDWESRIAALPVAP